MLNQTHGFGGKDANANRHLSLHRAIPSVTACHLDNYCTSMGRGWLLMGIDLRQPAVICQACTDHASNLDRFILNMRVMHILRRVSHAQRPITCIKTWFLIWGGVGSSTFNSARGDSSTQAQSCWECPGFHLYQSLRWVSNATLGAQAQGSRRSLAS